MSNFKLDDDTFKNIFPLKTPRDGQREIIEQIIIMNIFLIIIFLYLICLNS